MRNVAWAVAAAPLLSGTIAAHEDVRQYQQPQELRAAWITGAETIGDGCVNAAIEEGAFVHLP